MTATTTITVLPATPTIRVAGGGVYDGSPHAAVATVEVGPVSPGGGVPTGSVTLAARGKALGSAALSGGRATLAVEPGGVLGKPIMVTYEGAAGFLPSSVAAAPPTAASVAAGSVAPPGRSGARASAGRDHGAAPARAQFARGGVPAKPRWA